MEEQELRHALRGAMAATAQPPSMNSTAVLDTARRAQRRRRATLAGVASAGAVIVIAAGAMIVAATSGGDETPSGGVGAPPALTETAPPPKSESTETQWPDGQTDRTARQGPRYDKGAELLDLLTASLPDGLRAPTDLKPADPTQWSGELRYHQAQFEDEVNGKQIWGYLAGMPVGGDGKWGRLLVEVHTAGNAVKGDGCDLKLWSEQGTCELVDVGGKQVAVSAAAPATSDDPTGNQFDQWAAYRHPDGTVVFVAQAKSFFMAGLPQLAEPPLSTQQLAGLAADPKFRLG